MARGDQTTYRGDLEALKEYLLGSPDILAEIKQRGMVRLFVGSDKSDEADGPWYKTIFAPDKKLKTRVKAVKQDVERLLADLGIDGKIDVQVIKIDSRIPAADVVSIDSGVTANGATAEREDLSNPLVADVDKPGSRIRITAAIAKIARKAAAGYDYWIRDSIRKPTTIEIANAIGSKSIPFATSALQFMANFHEHPAGAIGMTALSLVLDTWFGGFASSWMRIGNKVQARFGSRGHTVFNWANGVFWGLGFRTIAYTTGISHDSPLALWYLGGLMTFDLVGATIGAQGTNGLNELYEHGAISYNARAARQQWLRDFVMMIGSTQFYLGHYWAWGGLYFLSQVLNLHYANWAKKSAAKAPPVLMVIDKSIVQSKKCADGLRAIGQGIPKPVKATPSAAGSYRSRDSISHGSE